MKFQFLEYAQITDDVDHIIVGFNQKGLSKEGQNLDAKFHNLLSGAIKARDFKGKLGESLTVFVGEKAVQVSILGLGEEPLMHKDYVHLGGKIAQICRKSPKIAIYLADLQQTDEAATWIAQGIHIGDWRFLKYKSDAEKSKTMLHDIYIEVQDPKVAQQHFTTAKAIAKGVAAARELVSEPANVLYPESFKDKALELKALGCEVDVLDIDDLQKKQMNAIISVGQGSERPPYMVVIRWKGSNDDPIALVGKGITFDTGGISLKPSLGMEDMIMDMGGAAAVFGTMKSLALRKAKANVIGILGLAENMPSGCATRPGDIITTYAGKTVEIMNTDAEGRLVLADCLTYAQKDEHAKTVVNLATLTGAMLVALGLERAGLFCNDDQLAQQLFDHGEATGDLLWRFPMGKEYDSYIKTRHADIKNMGKGRFGGSIAAAKFLEKFIEDETSWAHLDIAPTAWYDEDKLPLTKGASGFGVRLLEAWIQSKQG